MSIPDDWRNDSSITIIRMYVKKFAYFPLRLSDQKVIWWNSYYIVKQNLYNRNNVVPFRIEDSNPKKISEDEYLFRKIAGTLYDT